MRLTTATFSVPGGTIEGQRCAARLPRTELFLIAGPPYQRPLQAEDRGIVVDRSRYRDTIRPEGLPDPQAETGLGGGWIPE